VWAGEGRDHSALEAFYDDLGDERLGRLEAISLDMGGAYKSATDAKAPHVTQCVDPFHLVKLANEALDQARRAAWNAERRTSPVRPRPCGRPRKDAPAPPRNDTRWIKHTRWALLKDPGNLKPSQLDVLHELRASRSVLYRCWQLKEGIRDLYRLRPADAAEHLNRHVGLYLPGAMTNNGFDWSLLAGNDHQCGAAALKTQHVSVNVDPSDRYVQSVPGSDKHRLRPDESGYDNLVLAGDWTDCGMNAGCIEAAVMSGFEAANALLGRGRFYRIRGYWLP